MVWYNHLSVILENVGPKMFYFLIDHVGLFVYGGIIQLDSLNISTHKGHWGFVVVIVLLG